jgi:signal transduction histidine kinase
VSNDTFTVDTHLFRELGELLVGRDSTALVELIKNAYDADSSEVIVHGEDLDDPARGKIIVRDDGVGMNLEQFREGFLRIASRIKEQQDRRSPTYRRRFTGAKGIGRLAAHKLAKKLIVDSVPSNATGGKDLRRVHAEIDWQIIERQSTLDDIRTTDAISVNSEVRGHHAKNGTRIELLALRRKWTSAERARFFAEVQTFAPPDQLLHISPRILPKGLDLKNCLLFETPKIKDSNSSDPGFKVELTGDFEGGDDYWQSLAETAQWILEIDASPKDSKVKINVLPTRSGLIEMPEATNRRLSFRHPSPKTGPFLQARILIREGGGGNQAERRWMGRSSGLRVFMEGFRVLPYGEPNDDWLSLDADYKKRPRSLPFLNQSANLLSSNSAASDATEFVDADEGLLFLGNSNYFGAVFLTAGGAPTLQMLINREGFVPSADCEHLVTVLRLAIHLSVRVRAAAKLTSREQRRRERGVDHQSPAPSIDTASRLGLRQAVDVAVERATSLARESRTLAAEGKIALAQQRIKEAAAVFTEGAEVRERLMTEGAMLRVLASVGTQMSAFVHEINGLLGTASAVESAVDRILRNDVLPPPVRKELSQIALAVGDLRRSVERQASYLTDVVSADARRRRSRQNLASRFASAIKVVDTVAARKNITIENAIPSDLRSVPMFPAELSVVFSNLLTNAVKAAGRGGRIRATAYTAPKGGTILRIENTGRAVSPEKGERWFLPFESTTVKATEPTLGQGMGMGLPLTRNLLAEYGATIAFAAPQRGFATAVEIRFP